MTIQPGTDIGRYHILEQLGEGGMAVVYKAYDTRLETDVAIKVIRTENILPAALERTLKRFQIEAKKMAQLNHPNIVKVMDYGQFGGLPYLVMPYIPGGTLKQKLGNPMAWNEALRIVIPIAKALGYAHKLGLIHRDVKPSNILMTQTDEPMLSDFGVAKVLEGNETLDLSLTSIGVGTPEYMAPEQAVGIEFDQRADIYALGIVLFEMLTGRVPYKADTPMAVIIKQATEPLPAPRGLIPGLPVEAERVLFKMLAKDPKDRYADMGELIVVLGKLLNSVAPRSGTKKFNSEEDGKKPGKRWLKVGLIIVVVGAIFFGGYWVIAKGKQKTTQKANEEKPTLATPEIETTSMPLPYKKVLRASPKDNMVMVFVPAGEFLMGSDSDYENEKPQHKVFLDAYWIDRIEVTNRQYRKCIADRACSEPSFKFSNTRENYFGNDEFDSYPVIFVKWQQANEYCLWAGRRLPTEAEWEKAARGIDGRIYPWGNDPPEFHLANYGNNVFDTNQTGIYIGGESPYGAMEMAGNVWEWVLDWYGKYYENSPYENPQNLAEGLGHVLRGGSWNNAANVLRSSMRFELPIYETLNTAGFRCVVSDKDVKYKDSIKENFEGNTYLGTIPSGWPQWQVIRESDENSVLSINIDKSDLYPEQYKIGNYLWKNTRIKYRVKVAQCGSASGGGALIDLGGKYYLNMSCRHNQVYFNQWNGPNLKEVNVDITEGKWHQVEFDNSNSQLTVTFDGLKIISMPELSYTGMFGFSTDPYSIVFFDDIEIMH